MASALGHGAKLASVLADINAHHYAVAGPENPTPLWLKDMCVTARPTVCTRGRRPPASKYMFGWRPSSKLVPHELG